MSMSMQHTLMKQTVTTNVNISATRHKKLLLDPQIVCMYVCMYVCMCMYIMYRKIKLYLYYKYM